MHCEAGYEIDSCLDAMRRRVSNWPLPIAYPAAQCISSSGEPAALVNWSLQFFGQTLRLTSLFLAADYLASPSGRTDLNTAIADGLRRPLLGHWRGFLRDALDRLTGTRSSSPLVQAVHAFHIAVGVRKDTSGPVIVRDGAIIRGKVPTLDGILQMRNDLAHGAGALDHETAARLLTDLAPAIERIAVAFDALSGFRLIAEDRSGVEHDLQGSTTTVQVEGSCSIRNPDGSVQSLYPLALVDLMGEALPPNEAKAIDLLLYDGRHEKRLRFLGLHDVHERKDVYAAFSAALERKVLAAQSDDPVAEWPRARLRDTLALRQFQLEADGRAVPLPDQPIPRPAVEERLTAFLHAPAPAVWLTGAAGAGRSALLAVLVRRLLSDGVPALQLNCALLAPLLTAAPLEIVLGQIILPSAQLNELLTSANRPAERPGLVLGFDAIDAAGPPEVAGNLAGAIQELAQRYAGRGLKIIVASSTHAAARIVAAAPPLLDSVWFPSVIAGPDGEPIVAPEFPIEEFAPAEAEAFYQALVTSAVDGPLTPWRLLPAGVRERLRLPAFARRFVFALRGQHVRTDDDAAAVERAFLQQSLLGRRYDARRRAYVDAFPARLQLVTSIWRRLLSERRSVAPFEPNDDNRSDYVEALDRGVLIESPLNLPEDTIGVGFASPAMHAAVAAHVLEADEPLWQSLLADPALEPLARDLPGLETALIDVAERRLAAGRPWPMTEGGLARRSLALGLLRRADFGGVAGARAALASLADRGDDIESLIALALAQGMFVRPRGAAALAEAALEALPSPRGATLLHMAQAVRRRGQIGLAEKMLRIVPPDAKRATEARRTYLLGSLLRDAGHWDDALPLLRRAHGEYSALDDREGALAAQASIAETLTLLGRGDEAAVELDAALADCSGATLAAELHFRIKHAMSLRMRGLLRKAHRACHDVLARARAASLLPLVTRAETELGVLHSLMDDPAGAVEHLQQAIETKRQLGDHHGLKQAYLCLGFAHTEAGNQAAARVAYEESLRMNRETDDAFGEMLCLEFLARTNNRPLDDADLQRVAALAQQAVAWNNPRMKTAAQRLATSIPTEGETT